MFTYASFNFARFAILSKVQKVINFTNNNNCRSIKIKQLTRPLSTTVQCFYCNKNDVSDFVPIYKFSYIKLVSSVSKLSKYQLYFTSIAVPTSGILSLLNYINTDYFLAISAIGVTGTVTLIAISKLFFNNIIGFLYVDEKNYVLKISYLDAWGQRKNSEIPLHDIVPISDLPKLPTDQMYLTIKRYSTNENYKFLYNNGVVFDRNLLKFALGDCEK